MDKNETGETILHYLAKEGKVEIFESIFKKIQDNDQRSPDLAKYLVQGLLVQDELDWTPLMAATKAEKFDASRIIEMCLLFLYLHLESKDDLEKLVESKNLGDNYSFS